MTPEQQIKALEKRLDTLERVINVRANRIVLSGTVIVDGQLNADKVYTQRSGSYVELTT